MMSRTSEAEAQQAASDDPMKYLWATEGAFRMLTLAYSLFIHTGAVDHYTRPHLATALIAVQCIWSGVVALALFARPRWRSWLVAGDIVVTLGLMYATWIVADASWWDHNQSLPTTMWATNAVLAAGMQWGVTAGFLAGVGISLASLHIGDDLSWMVRSPTMPILVSSGIAAGVGGVGARRSHAQLVAALELRARAAERERLAREVHDGVLQVLALMGRKGPSFGAEGAALGQLATEQERALRTLIADVDEAPIAAARATSEPSGGSMGDAPVDLRRELLALADDRVRVSAGSAPVLLDAARAGELLAATKQALANTERHAGESATAFVLLEDLDDEVTLTVRDDGPGIPDGRLAEAKAQGRMGVSRSIVGRVESIGGRAHLEATPGEGVEWEFTLQR
ncbi:ATP-binding protein [Dermacoccus abyssi]|uniref:ATP-binding protein n=1 Tax=Dermacoccus abyssi TaxID=322596 RepID=A0ABX5Z6J6_9MICO|nr:ATP-binding protein [Dermacoccus abyssi]